jgi:hypothetical protein
MEVTLEDVKKFINENKLTPSTLFSKKLLEDDDLVIEIANKKNEKTHYAALRKDDAISKLEAEKKVLEEGLLGKDKEIADAKAGSIAIIAEKKIEEIFEKRKLSDKEPVLDKWAKRKLKEFKPTGDEEKIEEEAKSYIDGLIDEFRGYEKAGLQIIAKEEKPEDELKGKPPAKEEEKPKDKKAFPELDDSDILDPGLAKQISDRVAELNK